jgi:trans-2,3-dihydro-3-hydroxyanthranilate isomerase
MLAQSLHIQFHWPMAFFDFQTVDVFTDRRFGGNPLAVFPHAGGLDDAGMQSIAREFNLSETTFVFPPADPAHTARVRIFTPRAEVPFAGHPNVGTAYVLARLNPGLPGTLVFEETVGLVAVELHRGQDGAIGGAKVAAPQPLTVGEEVPVEAVAACAGLAPGEILRGIHAPVFAGVGMGFVIAQLTGRAALARANPVFGAFQEAARRFPRIGARFQLHLYVRDAVEPRRLATRMFAPLLGVPEDPATGSANATLAALLTHLGEKPEQAFDIEQGAEMGRPSFLRASARKSEDGAVRATIAGDCVPVMKGQVEL